MRSRSRSSLLTVFWICSILIFGYGHGHGETNAQDAPTLTLAPTPTPTESSSSGSGSDSAWYPDTSTSTRAPADSSISTSTSTSSSSASTSTSTSTPTGSWFPWFPTNIPTTTPPVTTDYPTPTPASDPYYPYPYPTYPPTSAPTYRPNPDPSYPTAYPTGTTAPSANLADRDTYWPWATDRGVLPTVEPSSSLNPDYDPRSSYVVWVVSANDSSIANSTVPSASSSSSLTSVLVRSSGDGIYFCARYSSWAGTLSFYESLLGYNRARYSNGVLEQFVKISSIDLSRLLMQFSYLDSSNRIPILSLSATISSYSYYITARSRLGEFRMFNVRSGWYSDACDMYYACINERGKDGKLYWETVKMVANGEVQLQTLGSRGSTLEHMGAFQWLEFSRYRSSSSSSSSSSSFSSFYLLISWRSLSGVRLSRYHDYSWYDSSRANAAYDWNVWYNGMYPTPNYYYYGMNEPVIILYQNGQVIRKTYTNYNDFIQLQQDYYSIVHTTTSAPTPYPNPYPYPYPYPYPTPSPNNPYNRDFTFTRNWSDLSNADRTFIIAYPIAIIGTGIILILITTCCIKCRERRAISSSGAAAAVAAGAVTSASSTAAVPASVPVTSLSLRFHNLSTVCVLLSFLSLVFLVVALIVNQFSFATFGTYTWVSYGPFSTAQTSPWRGWLNMYWTAQILGPTTAALIIFNILLLITNAIQLINIKRSNDFTTRARLSRPVITTCACFIMSCTAVCVWFLIHVRLLDPALARLVIDNYNSNTPNRYSYSSHFIVKIGTSAILLIIATGIQCASIVPMCRFIHLARQAQGQVPSVLLSVATVDYSGDQQSTSTSTRAQQAEQDGLQLVQIGSQYYYHASAGPAPVPVPAATPYVYGVPASGPASYAPVASAPPATASVFNYYPDYVPPSFQALAVRIPAPAPIQTTSISVPLSHTAAPAPTPAPSPSPSVYPALPVQVPESGPNTRYQRLL